MKPDYLPDFAGDTEEQQIRNALGTLIRADAIEKWLQTDNKAFNAKPIDLIKSGKTDRIWQMIHDVGSGMPT
jgi:hypothetical protein